MLVRTPITLIACQSIHHKYNAEHTHRSTASEHDRPDWYDNQSKQATE